MIKINSDNYNFVADDDNIIEIQNNIIKGKNIGNTIINGFKNFINLIKINCINEYCNNHVFGEYIPANSDIDLCNNGGLCKRTCEICNYCETLEVNALGHEYEIIDYECKDCGAHFQNINESHINPTTNESCNSNNIMTRKKCLRCGKILECDPITLNIIDNINGNFNIEGINIDGNSIKSTYKSLGYSTIIKINNNENLSIDGKNIEINNQKIIIDRNIISENNNTTMISFIISNNNDIDTKINLAVCADVQIDNMDKAPIFINNKGFKMSSDKYTYQVFLKNTNNVIDVDTIWIGNYSDRKNNLWNNSNVPYINNIDSGFAFSWQNRIIPGNSSITLSFKIQLL